MYRIINTVPSFIDLRAKLLRSQSLLDALFDGKDPNSYTLSRQEQDRAKRDWTGQTVIYKIDKKTVSKSAVRFMTCLL